jgi:hypothetical protein
MRDELATGLASIILDLATGVQGKPSPLRGIMFAKDTSGELLILKPLAFHVYLSPMGYVYIFEPSVNSYIRVRRDRLPAGLIGRARGLSLFDSQSAELGYADMDEYYSWMLPIVIRTYLLVDIDAEELADCLHREYIDTMWFFNEELRETCNLSQDTNKYRCEDISHSITEELAFRAADILQELFRDIVEYSPLLL